MKKILLLLPLMLISFLFLFPAWSTAEMKDPAKELEDRAKALPHGPATKEKVQIPNAESLGNGKFRIGNINVDTVKEEILVSGSWKMSEGVIEYIASMKDGYKLYETVLELDVNAYEFNLALILIGLDQKKGRASSVHFDPNAPEGDPVEIWVEWMEGSKKKLHRAEDLVLDDNSKKTMPHTNWVYTGSTILEDGSYMAQMDGVLIGFVHDPSVIIDSPSGFGLAQYGMLVVNKKLAPSVGTEVQLKVKSLKTGK